MAETGERPAQRSLTRQGFLGVAAAAGTALATCAGAAIPEAHADEADDADAYAGVGEDGSYYSTAGFVEPYALPKVRYQGEVAPKRVLVVVDYQVDFVDGGVFGRIEPAVAIEAPLCAKITEYLERGDVVIYTMDTHPADTYDLTREATVNPPHCDPATPGWQLYGGVRDLLEGSGALCIRKGTYGSFELVRAIQALRDQGTPVESIEFAGVSTTCRVLHNAVICYNAFPELPMIMDAATTASYTDERTVEQLEELEAWGFVVRR